MERPFNDPVDILLARVERLIGAGAFEDQETDSVEIKPVPPTGADWLAVRESVCAFLNTQGGAVVLGIKEERTPQGKRYQVTGWRPEAEPQAALLREGWLDRQGRPLDVPAECFPAPAIRDFMGQRVAVLYVEPLPTDRKFAFLKRRDGALAAYRRVLTGDKEIQERDLDRQDEVRAEAFHARELDLVEGTSAADIDLGRLNEFIYALNRPKQVETIKPTLEDAGPFLDRKSFVREGKATVLGMLVCGKHPGDRLGFRCHLHGYVDAPQQVAQDKQDLIDNVLQLMDGGLGYVLRNIQVGVKAEGGGTSAPQYPEDVLRETVNNALAHRDYTVDKQAFIAIKPGRHVMVRNPGKFRSHLLIERDGPGSRNLRRIIPEPKPRNPKLADALRAFKKWEGRGIGMSTLVGICLDDRMGLPTYQLLTEEVALYLKPGRLLDDRTRSLFEAFDGYLERRLGAAPTREELLVLAYLVQSEWANRDNRYAILLTPDNNHHRALRRLESAGLVSLHEASTPTYPVYVADPVLVDEGAGEGLNAAMAAAGEGLGAVEREVLAAAYRATKYSKSGSLSARKAAYALWYGAGKGEDIKAFEAHYRKVRKAVLELAGRGTLARSGPPARPEYSLAGAGPAS